MKLSPDGYRLPSGADPLEVVHQHGTPLFVYDAQVIRDAYTRMVRAFDVPALSINYAVKALQNINILKLLGDLGAGLDCVSIYEVEAGLQAGFEPRQIIFTPSAVSFEEIKFAHALGVRVNIDAIPLLERFGVEFPGASVCLRFNPHVFAGGHRKISVGHINSKFGISIHQLPHVLRLVKRLDLRVEGVHIHTGSDILDPDVFLAATEILFNTAKAFDDLEYIDFGSGFKVAYRPDDIETDIETIGQRLSARFNDFCKEYGKDLTLMLEPGKYLVSRAGYFLVRTNMVKQTTAAVFAGVNSGFNHLIRPMLYDAYHHIVNLSNPHGKPRIYNVVGYICETDTFAIDRPIAEIREGDILAIFNAGAYAFSMASNYNMRPRPAEVLILDGKAHLIRRAETLDDMMRTQIPLPDLFPDKDITV